MKGSQIGGQRIAWTRMSCICKLIKKYSSLYLFAGKKMGQGKQRAKPDIVGKENTGLPRHSCLRNDNHSPEGEVGSSETATLTPSRYWLYPQTGFATPRQGHGTNVDFFLSSGPLRKSQVGLTSTVFTLQHVFTINSAILLQFRSIHFSDALYYFPFFTSNMISPTDNSYPLVQQQNGYVM